MGRTAVPCWRSYSLGRRSTVRSAESSGRDSKSQRGPWQPLLRPTLPAIIPCPCVGQPCAGLFCSGLGVLVKQQIARGNGRFWLMPCGWCLTVVGGSGCTCSRSPSTLASVSQCASNLSPGLPQPLTRAPGTATTLGFQRGLCLTSLCRGSRLVAHPRGSGAQWSGLWPWSQATMF